MRKTTVQRKGISEKPYNEDNKRCIIILMISFNVSLVNKIISIAANLLLSSLWPF